MADPTVDDIAKQNPLKVLDIVKTMQKGSPTTPPISPVPRPRKNLSPIPRRRENKVTPPASPMRRRTSGKHDKEAGKPKPPVRRRRKFGDKKPVVEGSNVKNQEGEEGGLNGVQERLEEQGDYEEGEEEGGEGRGGEGRGGDEMVDGFVVLEENGDFATEETQSDSLETPEKPESPDIPERPDKDIPEKTPENTETPILPEEKETSKRAEVPRVPDRPEKPVSPVRPPKPERHDLLVKEKPKRPELPAAVKLKKFKPTSPEDGKVTDGVSADKDLTDQIADDSKNTEDDIPSINVSKEVTPERQPTPDSGEDKQAPDTNDSLTRRKKKPPPMPPAPYERQPPLPLKQRKQMSLKAVASSRSVDDPTVTSSLKGRNTASVHVTSSLGGRNSTAALHGLNKSFSTPLIDQVDQEIASEVTAPPEDSTEHIYEAVECVPTESLVPLRSTNHPENASSKCSRPASLDSTTNSEAGVNSSSPALKRGSTVGNKNEVRRMKSAPTKLKSRPLSDASLELMGSYEVRACGQF